MTARRVLVTLALLSPAALAGQAPPRGYLSVNPGSYHTCALAGDGTTLCWGRNKNGQLGRGTVGASQPQPQPVAGALTFARLSAGANHNCGLTQGGLVQCWGYNAFGQAGVKTPELVSKPVTVASPVKFVEISAGFTHTCAIAQGGDAYCWGDSRTGQGGKGVSGGWSWVPAKVLAPAGTRFTMIGAGGGFSCGLTSDGSVYCWGANYRGALGAPATDTCAQGRTSIPCTRTPILVGNGLKARYLSVGQSHVCAIAENGTLCWGAMYGEAPVAAAEGHRFAMLTVGSGHTCGLEGSSVLCWGSNFSGQLGNGSTDKSVTPVEVSGAVSFGSARAGFSHTCAIATSLSLFCWGDNLDGQLGDGTTNASSVPVRVQ